MFSIILAYYAIFAISTGIVSYLTIYRPILKVLKVIGVDNFEIANPKLTASVLIVMATIMAPFMIKPALFGPTEEFTKEFVEHILSDD